VTPARRLLLLIPAAVLALTLLLPERWRAPVPLCLVKALTGRDCPGCGMTRAFLLIGHGRFAAATAMHPASLPAYLIVAALALTGAARALCDRPTPTATEEVLCTAAPVERRSPPTAVPAPAVPLGRPRRQT
jgi:hypothetical protein